MADEQQVQKVVVASKSMLATPLPAAVHPSVEAQPAVEQPAKQVKKTSKRKT